MSGESLEVRGDFGISFVVKNENERAKYVTGEEITMS